MAQHHQVAITKALCVTSAGLVAQWTPHLSPCSDELVKWPKGKAWPASLRLSQRQDAKRRHQSCTSEFTRGFCPHGETTWQAPGGSGVTTTDPGHCLDVAQLAPPRQVTADWKELCMGLALPNHGRGQGRITKHGVESAARQDKTLNSERQDRYA